MKEKIVKNKTPLDIKNLRCEVCGKVDNAVRDAGSISTSFKNMKISYRNPDYDPLRPALRSPVLYKEIVACHVCIGFYEEMKADLIDDFFKKANPSGFHDREPYYMFRARDTMARSSLLDGTESKNLTFAVDSAYLICNEGAEHGDPSAEKQKLPPQTRVLFKGRYISRSGDEWARIEVIDKHLFGEIYDIDPEKIEQSL